MVGFMTFAIQPTMAERGGVLTVDDSVSLQLHTEISVLNVVDFLSEDDLKKMITTVRLEKKSEFKPVRLSSEGVVRSTNPVWNVCISGHSVSLGLIRHNRETYHYRRGHVKKEIPLSCRDYHTGDIAVWSHPDFPGLEVTLDAKGHLKGGIQQGYIAVRDNAHSTIADQGESVAKN